MPGRHAKNRNIVTYGTDDLVTLYRDATEDGVELTRVYRKEMGQTAARRYRIVLALSEKGYTLKQLVELTGVTERRISSMISKARKNRGEDE